MVPKDSPPYLDHLSPQIRDLVLAGPGTIFFDAVLRHLGSQAASGKRLGLVRVEETSAKWTLCGDEFLAYLSNIAVVDADET